MLAKEDFAAEIERRCNTLYRVAYTILRNDENVKDALQNTALAAWEKLSSLRDPALFGTWITRILINECHSFERRSRKYLLQREVQSAATNPEEVSDVRIALNGLPEKLRLPLVLHYLEGYSYAEISKMLRVRQSTVRSRLSRARDALCIEITENEGALK